jgi:hypothetical protein
MGRVDPLAASQLFDPATCKALGLAFDTAWQKLLVSGSALASSGYAAVTREALAMHIIDLANKGERDVNRLRDDAVAFVTDALRRDSERAAN